MGIPEQLKPMRFNRVLFKDKKAFETGWQKNPYNYEQATINFTRRENYGVMCGPELRVLDDDTKDKRLIKLFLETFGDTFRVRDHLYSLFDNGFSDKIVFYDEIGEHMGELQGEGTYVVGPGSIHPSGEIYDVKNNLDIRTISYDKFMEVFGKFIKKKKNKIVREHKPTDWTGDNITDIPIGNIISFIGLRDVSGGSYQGPHPQHGSTNTGMNFRVNTFNNTWYCFRCHSGGGPSELIGVMEGIISCDEAGKSCYSDDQGREVIKIAREKYGLEVPEKQQNLGEVRGWANSVSITKLAKKHDFENCHICGEPWKLQESHGMYYCTKCKFGGGLKKFAELILKRIKQKT